MQHAKKKKQVAHIK